MAKKLPRNKIWEDSDRGDSTSSENPGSEGMIELSPEEAALIQEARLKRAKALAADPAYPTEEIVQTLAEMLARHWYSGK